MVRHQWLRALPLVVMAALAVSQAEAGEIRDRAGMFSAEAVRKARAELDRTEKKTGISVLIETIDAIPGLDKSASANVRKDAIETLAERRAREAGSEGVYLLLSKNDKLSSQILVRERYEPLLPREARQAVRDAMLAEFKSGKYDQGLLKAVETMDRSLASAPAGPVRLRGGVPAPAPGVPRRANADGGKFGLGTLLMIGLGIFGVLLLLRVLRGAFGQPAGGYPAGMGMGGMPRPGMGPGPGYGAPGYGGYGGGRGGGFFSGMLGGLGGAWPATGFTISSRAVTAAIPTPRPIWRRPRRRVLLRDARGIGRSPGRQLALRPVLGPSRRPYRRLVLPRR